MTLREMFKKVETYNEIANLMHTDKAVIEFSEGIVTHEKFDSYKEMSKFIKREYIKEVADKILKADWELDGEIEFSWTDAFGTTWEYTCGAYLVTA